MGELGYGYDLSSRRVAASGSFARTGIPTAVATTTYDSGNHLTKWGTPTLTYDANGNVSKDASGATYTWNNRNQLGSISGGGITASFSYDALGRRTKATVNGATTQFLSDGSNLVQEQSSTGVPTANLLTGLGVDSLFARTEGATTRSLLTDGLGSTLALASAAGAIETSYTYEPFGKTTVSGSASTNKTQFTGRENDGATGPLLLPRALLQPLLRPLRLRRPTRLRRRRPQPVRLRRQQPAQPRRSLRPLRLDPRPRPAQRGQRPLRPRRRHLHRRLLHSLGPRPPNS